MLPDHTNQSVFEIIPITTDHSIVPCFYSTTAYEKALPLKFIYTIYPFTFTLNHQLHLHMLVILHKPQNYKLTIYLID